MCLRNDQVEYVTCKIIIAFGEDNNKTENVRYVGSLVYKAICTAPFTDRYPCTGSRLSKHLQRHLFPVVPTILRCYNIHVPWESERNLYDKKIRGTRLYRRFHVL